MPKIKVSEESHRRLTDAKLSLEKALGIKISFDTVIKTQIDKNKVIILTKPASKRKKGYFDIFDQQIGEA